MANPNDPVFEIDAGKILAKLHLAGQQQLNSTDKNAVAINTGIVNPVASADPAKPGNVEFNLDNKSGEYQFAILKLLTYKVPLDINKNRKIIKLKEEIEKAKKKEKLTDKVKDKNNATYKAQENYLKTLEAFKLKGYKADYDNYDESIKEFVEAVKIENEERKKEKEENIKKIQKNAFENIKTYFKTVSGEKNAAKIKEQDLVLMNADIKGEITDPTKFYDFKDFKIDTVTIDEGIKKLEQDIQESDKPHEQISRHIMFAIGFTVEIETM